MLLLIKIGRDKMIKEIETRISQLRDEIDYIRSMQGKYFTDYCNSHPYFWDVLSSFESLIDRMKKEIIFLESSLIDRMKKEIIFLESLIDVYGKDKEDA